MRIGSWRGIGVAFEYGSDGRACYKEPGRTDFLAMATQAGILTPLQLAAQLTDYRAAIALVVARQPDPSLVAERPELAQKRRSIELAEWSACWGEADPL